MSFEFGPSGWFDYDAKTKRPSRKEATAGRAEPLESNTEAALISRNKCLS